MSIWQQHVFCYFLLGATRGFSLKSSSSFGTLFGEPIFWFWSGPLLLFLWMILPFPKQSPSAPCSFIYFHKHPMVFLDVFGAVSSYMSTGTSIFDTFFGYFGLMLRKEGFAFWMSWAFTSDGQSLRPSGWGVYWWFLHLKSSVTPTGGAGSVLADAKLWESLHARNSMRNSASVL